ncbi:MAG: hypothetical protein ACP5SG_06325 [Dissulfurimicrobium sp.]|uniref:hypothetical protein n=1 Tax=Dissulfurimicrobium sp. TaxID=2022436 RepID=UPI003D124354
MDTTLMDRVIQQAMAQVLMPMFDPEFQESSFSFRSGRSAYNQSTRYGTTS